MGRRKQRPAPEPVNPAEGPWMIWSHYWGRWHRRGSDGAASGYTDDIARAGVFDLSKAREYHDLEPNGRDEAIPRHRVLEKMEVRAAEIAAEHAAALEKLRVARAALSPSPTTEG